MIVIDSIGYNAFLEPLIVIISNNSVTLPKDHNIL